MATIDINRINKRLMYIKEHHKLQPVTLKPKAVPYNYMIEQKGTGSEGLFLDYEDAKKRFNKLNKDLGITLSKERYEQDIQEFMNLYSKETYSRGAINEAYKTGKLIIAHIEKEFPELYDMMKGLTKTDFVHALQFAGEMHNSKQLAKSSYESAQDMHSSLITWFEENDRISEDEADELRGYI